MQPTAVIVMGVSGSGKTTVGREVAATLGWDFLDADDLHSRANIDRMRAGIALTDGDRAPWLRRVRAVIDQHLQSGTSLVVACSALRQAYREALGVGTGNAVRLVYLHGARVILESRLHARAHHFMSESLLQSQLDTLEEPGDAFNVDITEPLPAAVAAIVTWLRSARPAMPDTPSTGARN